MGKITDNDLQEYIDERMPEELARSIKVQIDADPELKAQYDALVEVDKHLHQLPVQKISEGFTSRVMANLYNIKYQPSSYFQKRNLMTLLSILCGVVIGIYILSSSLTNITFFENLNINPIGVQEKEIDLNPYLNFFTSDVFIKSFVFFDLLLALFLLDIGVLKPYFKNRRNRISLRNI